MAEEKQCVLVLIGADEWGRKEVEKEARIASRLDHVNIAGVLDDFDITSRGGKVKMGLFVFDTAIKYLTDLGIRGDRWLPVKDEGLQMLLNSENDRVRASSYVLSILGAAQVILRAEADAIVVPPSRHRHPVRLSPALQRFSSPARRRSSVQSTRPPLLPLL